MTLIRGLVVLVAFNCMVVGAEPQKETKRQFPAKITVASSKLLNDGRRELELNLALEKNIEVYANPVGDEAFASTAMKVSIVTVDGRKVPAEISYPKASRSEDVEGIGKLSVFTDTVKIQIRFVPSQETSLKVQCDVAGWNSHRACCLGRARLEAEIPTQN